MIGVIQEARLLRTSPFALLAALILGAMATAVFAREPYDLILRGGSVLDGTGATRYVADVGVRDGRITAIGNLDGASAHADRDVRGLFVAPGFINIHDHAEMDALASATNMLAQGVTTEIAYADGLGAVDPVSDVATAVARTGTRVNIGSLVGFNAAWKAVMGDDLRAPTPADNAAMQGIIVDALKAGAFGVSSGLDFAPTSNATPTQVAEILKPAAPWRAIFQNHERLNAATGFSSQLGVAETLAVARRSGLIASVTHIKEQGHEQGRAAEMLATMDAAQAEGRLTFADVYPYLAGQTALQDLLIPAWAQSGGRDAMLARFRDPVQRERIASEAEVAMKARFGGPKGVFVLAGRQELSDMMRSRGVGAGEAVIQALEAAQTPAILRFGAENDLEDFLRWPNTAVACDCGATHQTNTHPRSYGAFPRVLGVYVRQRGVLGWEDAVRRMTALPAAQVGLVDRGVIAPGMAADLVVFDPATVIDRNTFEAPSEAPAGIGIVIVNGNIAMEEGRLVGRPSGAMLRRASYMPARPQKQPSGLVSASGSLSGGGTFDFTVNGAAKSGRGWVRFGGATPLDLAHALIGRVETADDWSAVIGLENGQGFVLTLDAKGPEGPVLVLQRDGASPVSSPMSPGFRATFAPGMQAAPR